MESPRGRSARARRGRRVPPARRRALLYGVLAAVAVVGGAAAGTVYVTAGAHSAAPDVSSAASAAVTGPAGSSGEAGVERVAGSGADRDALLAGAMEAVAVADGQEVSVAVLDPESGATAVYGDGTFDTASIVKVDILAALLLQAQDAGRELTAAERAYAAAMIRNSDNASASALWRAIGRAAGLDAANERFGLTRTEGGDGMLWGLTRTTAADQLELLRTVFGTDSELDAASRAYLQELMGHVAADQDWGVSAAGSAFALKNGWLPRSTTGLWDVNSIGRVTAGGRACLVAVLSHGSATKAEGIALVEAAAKAAVPVVATSA
ncbi:serine hydrolase [Streptomyces sp. NPDC085946]|uniref:serine hydrolase n=1 Tax=Streptomyces sp. NPDC085946 TaxID=3365744 RepID=UPI0037D8B06F